MDTQIISLTAEQKHFKQLMALGETYYPPEHSVHTEEFLKWFYLDNPMGAATLIVAHEGDLWIGLIALIPIELKSSGKLQKACYAVNVLTHPEHRTKNLFSKMITYARDLLSKKDIWLLGHPNASAMPFWKRKKMEFRETLSLYLAKIRVPFSSVKLKTVKNLDDLRTIPSEFWDDLNKREDFHVAYNPEFLGWRYLNAPHKKYRVVAVFKQGKLLGLRVTRQFKGPVDLMVDYIGTTSLLGEVLSSVQKPTLVMLASHGEASLAVMKGCWKLPFKREFPFFVTTWGQERRKDMSGITLAASDF